MKRICEFKATEEVYFVPMRNYKKYREQKCVVIENQPSENRVVVDILEYEAVNDYHYDRRGFLYVNSIMAVNTECGYVYSSKQAYRIYNYINGLKSAKLIRLLRRVFGIVWYY